MKSIMRHPLILVSLSIIQKSRNNKCWWGWGEKCILIHGRWERKWVLLLWRTVWRLLRKLKLDLPCDTIIPLWGIHPQEIKSLYERLTCTSVFISSIHNRNLRRSTYMSISRCLDKENVMEYYTAIKELESWHLKQRGWKWKSLC